uniref:hypothetical protein n=1 Tax=Campylobacter coli TaxID=195 RepID=UPI000AECC619
LAITKRWKNERGNEESSTTWIPIVLFGKRDKNCWGDAVSILKTPNKQPYYFNFHQSSGANKNDFGELFLANTLILGQSGGGKTVFMNFIVDQMMKYASKDTFPDDIPEE